MKEKEISKLYNSITNVDNQFIEEAQVINYKKKVKKSGWLKWGAIAACFAVVALGIGLFQGGWFGNDTDIATLDNGSRIVFVKSDTVAGSLSLDIDVETKQLTEEEAHTLFADLPITACTIYMKSSLDTGNSQNLIGLKGEIGTIKIIVSTSDIQLIDTVITGKEKSTEINGTDITAGYFVTDPNSKGEQNAIYYAAFELGNCKIYLENSGTIDNSEVTKNQLAEVIQKLIENGELDLTSFLDNEAGINIDGNPDGYEQTADMAPMVCINRALYQIAGSEPGLADKEDEFSYLGEISSKVSSSQKPTEDFQANDDIIGSKVYQYDECVVVEINGQYWLYELLYEYQK